ncbi:hypothetical protein Slu03_06240 [Sediminihabitans luteus]|nr:hypothetical protein Slu03_06240 [Sediminihabitans luteus]
MVVTGALLLGTAGSVVVAGARQVAGARAWSSGAVPAGEVPAGTVLAGAVLVGVALACVALGAFRAAGPVGLSRAQVVWWLPLPVPRRALLLPSVLARLGLVVLAAVVLAATVLVAAGAPAPVVVGGSVVTGGVVVLLHAVATLAQIGPGRARGALDAVVELGPPVALAVLVLAGLGAGLAGTPVPAVLGAVPGGGGSAAVVGCIALAGLAVVVLALVTEAVALARLDRASVAALAAAAGARERHHTDLMSMRASAVRRPPARPRAGALGRTTARPWRRGPAWALLRAHRLAWARRRVVPSLLTAALVPAVVAGSGVTQGSTPLFVFAVAAATLRAVTLAGVGARTIAESPAFAAHVPLRPRAAAGLAAVVPGVVLLAWTVVTTGLLTLVGLPVPGPAALVPLAAGLSVAAVRGATRGEPDWSAPLLATPAGGLPWGWVVWCARGRVEALAVLGAAVALAA